MFNFLLKQKAFKGLWLPQRVSFYEPFESIKVQVFQMRNCPGKEIFSLGSSAGPRPPGVTPEGDFSEGPPKAVRSCSQKLYSCFCFGQWGRGGKQSPPVFTPNLGKDRAERWRRGPAGEEAPAAGAPPPAAGALRGPRLFSEQEATCRSSRVLGTGTEILLEGPSPGSARALPGPLSPSGASAPPLTSLSPPPARGVGGGGPALTPTALTLTFSPCDLGISSQLPPPTAVQIWFSSSSETLRKTLTRRGWSRPALLSPAVSSSLFAAPVGLRGSSSCCRPAEQWRDGRGRNEEVLKLGRAREQDRGTCVRGGGFCAYTRGQEAGKGRHPGRGDSHLEGLISGVSLLLQRRSPQRGAEGRGQRSHPWGVAPAFLGRSESGRGCPPPQG